MRLPYVKPIIYINGVKCYTYAYAQDMYEKLLEDSEREVHFKLFERESDRLPKFDIVIDLTSNRNANLYLLILSYFNSPEAIKRVKWIGDDDNVSTFTEDLMNVKYLKEMEEWYIQYVLNREDDLILNGLVQDPYEYKEYAYYSPADIMTMAYFMGCMDKASGKAESLEDIIYNITNFDPNYLVNQFYDTFHVDYHSDIVDRYTNKFSEDNIISKRILKNNNTYKNLQQSKINSKGLKK